MRSCERCFCAAGFAQTWPPWSMRVSEKSSSNEKEGDATQGTQRARAREEPRAQVEVGAPTEEDDHHRGIVVKVVGVEEGDAWGRRVCVVCAEEKERRGWGAGACGGG